ncbi:MAG: amidohydrolase family protein, partial [Thermoanaerobaculia bacterium]|nr:amidohydrolase family protein [Thermoanaerobaculia bacterium]
VQVLIPARTEHPLGSRLYHPVWQAIEERGLVAGIHFGGAPVMPPTPTGWPSTFLEEYTAMAQVFATQLTSLVVEGVFDAFPRLRVAFLESGFTWLPAHLWRMDKEWRNLRRLVPWVRRPPSEYVREHVRFSLQPLDPPPSHDQMLQVVDQLESDDLLLYASDYTHRHAFEPGPALLDHVPAGLRRKIESDNARDFYAL